MASALVQRISRLMRGGLIRQPPFLQALLANPPANVDLDQIAQEVPVADILERYVPVVLGARQDHGDLRPGMASPLFDSFMSRARRASSTITDEAERRRQRSLLALTDSIRPDRVFRRARVDDAASDTDRSLAEIATRAARLAWGPYDPHAIAKLRDDIRASPALKHLDDIVMAQGPPQSATAAATPSPPTLLEVDFAAAQLAERNPDAKDHPDFARTVESLRSGAAAQAAAPADSDRSEAAPETASASRTAGLDDFVTQWLASPAEMRRFRGLINLDQEALQDVKDDLDALLTRHLDLVYEDGQNDDDAFTQVTAEYATIMDKRQQLGQQRQ